MDSYKRLLLANKAWVKERTTVEEKYFENMAKDQRPEYLWIGCSDSRVPAEEITGSDPGELFVHRNIANLVVHTDFNLLSVLQFAVEVLEVKHIIVCGHYGCGGVKNAMSNKHLGLINKWLRHIKDVYRIHETELLNITDEKQRFKRLVECNVLEQVNNLAQTSIVQNAWHLHKRPFIHGWVYDLETGFLKDLVKMTHDSKIDDIYRYDLGDRACKTKMSEEL